MGVTSCWAATRGIARCSGRRRGGTPRPGPTPQRGSSWASSIAGGYAGWPGAWTGPGASSRGIGGAGRRGPAGRPAAIRRRSKQGFGAPVRSWLVHPTVAPLVQEHLVRPGGRLAGLIDPTEIQRAAAAGGQRAWIFLVLALWLDSRKTPGALPD